MRKRIAMLIVAMLPCTALADDSLWSRLQTDENLVVLMRHTQAGGGHPLAWDESGRCKGELVLTTKGKAHARSIGKAFASHGIAPVVISSPMCRCLQTAHEAFQSAPLTDPDLREVASADGERARAHETKALSLIAANRGKAPIVFVSHRPNIDQLTMELITDGELLVGQANERGEIEVLGKIAVP
ncbi:MAG: histidine phosphatase family protein [Burkholderiaceae bacterium]|nr:histidine phosphatase family protein [Burkholderiaceae bacterium]